MQWQGEHGLQQEIIIDCHKCGHTMHLMPIYAYHNDVRYNALLLKNGRVLYGEYSYSPSSLAYAIIGASGAGHPSRDGWTSFWKYRDADGDEKKIGELRRLHWVT